MSRRDLEREIHIPYNRITPWFRRNTAKPNASDLHALAAYFDVSPEYLLSGDTVPSEADRLQAFAGRIALLNEEGLMHLESYLDHLVGSHGETDKPDQNNE